MHVTCGYYTGHDILQKFTRSASSRVCRLVVSIRSDCKMHGTSKAFLCWMGNMGQNRRPCLLDKVLFTCANALKTIKTK